MENTGVEDLDKLLINTLFEVSYFLIIFWYFYALSAFSSLCINIILWFYQAVYSESRDSPFILFMKDAEKSIVGNTESYSTFKSRLEKLPDNVVIIGSHTHTDNRKEKVFLFVYHFVLLHTFLKRMNFSIFWKIKNKNCIPFVPLAVTPWWFALHKIR